MVGWLIFALLSAIFAALVAIFGKIGLQNIDTHTATAIRAIVMAVFLFAIVIIEGKLHNFKTILINNKALFYIILSGIAGALSWLFYFVALKGAKVSQIVPIDRLSVVFALLLAVLFLGEKTNWQTWIGAGLIVIGGVLVAIAK
jgi:bacterial/archaeal transporter family protein